MIIIQKAIEQFSTHQRTTITKRTIISYRRLLMSIESQFYSRSIDSIAPEEISQFLDKITDGLEKSTKRLRYAQIKAFFNFAIDTNRLNIKNPCSMSPLFKAYKCAMHRPRKIFDKETIDELIFKTKTERDRLILELQARCGLRVGEVLTIRVSDISGRKIMIHEPKSGKGIEVAFMPEHIASRLSEYVVENGLSANDKVFKVSYTSVRKMLSMLGQTMDIRIAPHDLRRHSATYASRNGVPLEIISKVLLRHADLKTTQVYLGKVSDTEAIRWMDILHGK